MTVRAFATLGWARPMAIRIPVATFAACLMLAGAGSSLADTGPPATAPATSTSSVFLFSGHGWGHGLGMSQYGALGYAQHGVSYDQILAHYYPGTTLSRVTGRTVRVLLLENRKSMPIGSDAPFRVRDGSGVVHTLAAGSYTLGPDFTLPVDDGTVQALTGPLVFLRGTSPLRIAHLWRGQLQVSVTGGKLQVIDVVGLEAYLQGVVPSEMPSWWPAGALEAQAVAARSYALAHVKGPPYAFDLYGDVRSQAYGGISAESAPGTAAVSGTKGQVLTYGGKVADTWFFSTSGGRTESAADVLPAGSSLPYLASVDDPYDSLSPYHDWGPVSVSGTKVAKALKVPGQVLDISTTPNAAGRVGSAVAVGTKGQVTVTGSKLRSSLGLRSTWFDVGLLSLARPTAPAVYGSAINLTGVVRTASASGAELEQQQGSGSWQPLQALAPDAGGSFAVTVTPTVTTTYRLRLGTVVGPSVRIPVTPAISLDPIASGATVVSGRAQPLVPGATAQVQQSTDSLTWTTVADAPVDASGAFAANVQVLSGSYYRVLLAPGHGLAPGATQAVQVAPS
jgi:stage II sporulation protein D